MSLDKAIKYGKEKRKKFFKSKAFDSSCRNHGSCGYCEGNRRIRFNKTEEQSIDAMKEARKDGIV